MAATDYDFLATRTEIIESALRKVGGLARGEVLSAYKSTNAILALNAMVKAWQNENIFLWSEVLFPVTTAIGTASYAGPTNPPFLSLDKAFIRESSIDTPLEVYSWRKYQDIENKADRGKPMRIAYDTSAALIYFHTVPDALYTIYTFGVAKLKDFEAAAGSGDFSSRWSEALMFGLAYRLSFEYPASASQRPSLKTFAEGAFMKAKNMEGSLNSNDHTHAQSNFPGRTFR